MKCYPISEHNAKKFTANMLESLELHNLTPILFGIRDESHVNTFNDIVGIQYWENNIPKVLVTSGTTDPGLPWILKPMRLGGSAILATGLHQDIWRLGNRKSIGKNYKNIIVFRQDGSSCKIYRDKNKDGKVQPYEPIQNGNFEIQFHPMSGKRGQSARVGYWSAGCQGPNDYEAYKQIRGVAIDYDKKTKKRNRYSYLLMGRIGDQSNYPEELLKPLE